MVDLYSFLLLITFILLPFNYFYSAQISYLNEEDDFDLDLNQKKPFVKVKKALISTCFFVFAITCLLMLGLFFRPGKVMGVNI